MSTTTPTTGHTYHPRQHHVVYVDVTISCYVNVYVNVTCYVNVNVIAEIYFSLEINFVVSMWNSKLNVHERPYNKTRGIKAVLEWTLIVVFL